jgi:hypothetical protein
VLGTITTAIIVAAAGLVRGLGLNSVATPR